MSIPVDLAALQAQISEIGSSAFLVTASTEGAPHISSVLVTFDGDNLAMGAGRQTRANATARPSVSLVWSAEVEGDYCLIVDATVADVTADGLVVRPTSAVLHRLARAPAGVPRCIPLTR